MRIRHPFWHGQRHGGNLVEAVAYYGGTSADWLDLSAGLNPTGWRYAQPLPAAVLHDLPQPDEALWQACEGYYGERPLLLGAGSQSLIMALPALLPRSRLGISVPGYSEHARAWRRAGHALVGFAAGRIEEAWALIEQGRIDHLLLIQPHNPLGIQLSPRMLRALAQALALRGGWLLVDEAYIDLHPEQSLLAARPANVVVWRSLGKFFGLAGLRFGALFGPDSLRAGLQRQLGPWSVSGPALWLAQQALRDERWQVSQREQLLQQGSRLQSLLQQALPGAPVHSTGLFVSVVLADERAIDLAEGLAQQRILVRRYPAPNGEAVLRFGLPGGEGQARLAAALQSLCQPFSISMADSGSALAQPSCSSIGAS